MVMVFKILCVVYNFTIFRNNNLEEHEYITF